ncbi:MAG: iron-sulfur cluster assembly protein [Deltaproteobacteria bacterium]|jgi:metal-sulfur cluster biosynthetic enzyme|nr:iron-sulfur cluster assembly protein [Deltaproteobacteria bacterium]MCK5422567.1 iron-sulfur cluster assembly protein [Deltaproteobacteria bacterium]MCK5514489.1 iron-sulfur cluster assembly protein [Deltaproteobacteria bacterium]
MDLREKVIQALKGITDPGTTMDVVSMGLIKNLDVRDDGEVSLDFQPSSNVCPLVLTLALKIQNSLKNLNEVKNFSVTVIGHQKADEMNGYLKEEGE